MANFESSVKVIPYSQERVYAKLSDLSNLESVKGVQCCGLGGCASVKEPEIAKHMASALAGEEKVYSYCASCSGNLTR